MAFVVITCLDPELYTLLPNLLAKYTPMEVHVAEEGMSIEPNNVFVIPPNAYMSIQKGRLHLEESQRSLHRQLLGHFPESPGEDKAAEEVRSVAPVSRRKSVSDSACDQGRCFELCESFCR